MIEQTTLTLKNDVSELDKVLTAVAGLCARHSIPPDVEYDLNLALDEIVTNVIRYAYPPGGERQFTVQINVDGQDFVAHIEDDGQEFDLTAYPPPNLDVPLEERKEGGLGIFLVRQIMNSVEYQRVNGKNIVTLRKKLNTGG